MAQVSVPNEQPDIVPRRAGRNMEKSWRWIFLSPSLLILLGLALLPVLNLVVLSFLQVSWSDTQSQWKPVGFANYQRLGNDALFSASVSNTIVFAFFVVSGQIILGLALAYICTQVTKRRTFYRAVFLLPLLIPGIVIGAIWKLMLNIDFGLFNQLLALINVNPVPWLSSPSLALMSIIVVDIWHWTPFCFLIFLATLEALPKEVIEAARVDGVSIWQEFYRIALPMIAPSIAVVAVFRLIVAFKVFDEIYLLTAGGPGTATEVMSFSIYRRFFSEDNVGYGSAMAISVILGICLFVAVLSVTRRHAIRG